MSDFLNIKILDRDEDGTTWSLSIPSVQNTFDIVVQGYFRHRLKARRASEWGLFAFHKCNGQEAAAEQIESLIGHGCRDRANEILETILGPIMENDFDLWEQNLEAEENDARNEERLQNAAYRRSAGF